MDIVRGYTFLVRDGRSPVVEATLPPPLVLRVSSCKFGASNFTSCLCAPYFFEACQLVLNWMARRHNNMTNTQGSTCLNFSILLDCSGRNGIVLVSTIPLEVLGIRENEKF